MLEYDIFFRIKYTPEQHVSPLLERMIQAGFGDGIALATDMAEHSMWEAAGPQAFITSMQREVLRRGIPPVMVADLVGGNISRRLATSVRRTPSR